MSPPTSAPIRVVVLIDLISQAGGAEIIAVELLRRLNPERFKRRLVVYRYADPTTNVGRNQDRIVTRLRRDGVVVDLLDGVSRWDLACWRPLARQLHAGDIDVLHTHKHGPNLWGGLLSPLGPSTAFVAHEHTWSFARGDHLRRLSDRWVSGARADAVLAVSDADRRRLVEVVGIPSERVRLLPNGIDAPPAATTDLRSELSLAPGATVVGAVGGLRPQKAYTTLIRAHRKVLAQFPDAHLVIVGGGELERELRTDIVAQRLTERVHITGFRPDAAALGRQFDVAVNSSSFEGSSLAIMEFMACARPIVATAVGGTPDLLDDGQAGLLVPPGEPDALAEAICSLLAEPGRAARLGAAAARRQEERFGVARQVERLEALYEEIYAARRTG